uniref:Uncharacterized protein, isoform B n=1 Tax=Drosophila melanogaster TaxID=7227 RepID=X2JAG3_DROME|nr:uncharacterized protein Dmel_CG33648, isoform B [Drosophila melanogaster]AHN54447.1 uncharacterized protein Dmel_CG33648, isoform B [Drosophila melanogaster]|eukprot:NP_001285933.1 uncharacterized protein Dmel_CG33648, isoform B [Drosophila melanogaster]
MLGVLVRLMRKSFGARPLFAGVEFTNIKCSSSDTSYVYYESCRIKSVNRTYKYISVNSRLLILPLTNATINVALYKRYNGYKPFLYNVSVDACRFLRTQKSNIVVKYLFDLILLKSNIRSPTCPFNSFISVDKLTTNFLNNKLTQVLPVPEGDYLFAFRWFSYNIYRSSVNVYITIS